jgi:hypothetical protein
MTNATTRFTAGSTGWRGLIQVMLALSVLLIVGCQRADGAGPVTISAGEGSGGAAPAAAPEPTAGASSDEPSEAAPAAQQSTPEAAAAPLDPLDHALAYARCIRENGYPAWPDPNPDGQFVLVRSAGMSFDDPRRVAAMDACQELRPEGLGAPGFEGEDVAEAVLAFARCMRENGVPEFPDPAPGAGGRVVMGPGQITFDPTSPRFQAALRACAGRLPGMMAR